MGFFSHYELNVVEKICHESKPLFDIEVKGQGPTKVITGRNTPPYGH
jgi:hypothetical protein